MVRNDKKFCPLHSISPEPYIIWLSFMVLIYKMITSSGVFLISSKFWILVHRRGKGAKHGPEWQKIMSLTCHISETIYHMNVIYGTNVMCKMIISPGVFCNFNILIFRVVRGLKGQKMAQNNKNFCLSHLIFQELYIIWCSFMVHMHV